MYYFISKWINSNISSQTYKLPCIASNLYRLLADLGFVHVVLKKKTVSWEQ